MASSVFYKFKSQRDESRVTFDGTGISIFDLKKEIILANNLTKAKDMDIAVFDPSSNQEYTDDTVIIPRSSSVVVKRVPSARPGKGKVGMYIGASAGAPNALDTIQKHSHATIPAWQKGAVMSKRFDNQEEASSNITPAIKPASNAADEATAMAAMFQLQSSNWEETQEKMSHAVPIHNRPRGIGFTGRGAGLGKPTTPHMSGQPYRQPDRPLPPSYVCYRCGQKGHWIQDCPTNADRDFDNRPRIKRTTGIPRSFLKTVENPNNGAMTQGVMVTPEGGYVIAEPDSASWQKQVARSKGLSASDIRERTSTDPTLVCPIDSKLFRDAVQTPCCRTTYCEECIQNHLLEKDFTCLNCSKKILSLDKLIADQPMRTKVADYIEKAIEESKKEPAEEDQDLSASGKPATPEDGKPGESEYLDQGGISAEDQIAIINASIPQVQAQMSQLATMLSNPALPKHIRDQTAMQHQSLQIQLQQLQGTSAMIAAAATFQQPAFQQQLLNGGLYGIQAAFTDPYGNGFGQQPINTGYAQPSVNNRKANLKRDRPEDFVDTSDVSKLQKT